MNMYNLIFIFILFYTQFFSQAFSAERENCRHSRKHFRCVEYVKNYDGDTITVNIPNVHPLIGRSIKVRVKNIDTPEIKTNNACEKGKALTAQKEVEHLLQKARTIHLRNVSRGKYFRILADVTADGVSIGQYLLQKGLAAPYRGGKKQKINWCNSLPR